MTLPITNSQSPTSVTECGDKTRLQATLSQHIHQKRLNNERLRHDPALNNLDAFKESMDQIRHNHRTLHPEQVHPKKINASIGILGNSFSWQGHVINHFNTDKPTQDWQRVNVVHIAYSSSYWEKGTSETIPYVPRKETAKQSYHPKTRKKVLQQIPRNQHITIVDMVNSGAGLASFLNLKSRSPQPKLLAFVPKRFSTPSPLNNAFFSSYESRTLAIESSNETQLENICNDRDESPIRGITSTKIYEPPPKPIAKDPLFYIKLSHLIQEMKTRYQSPTP